MKLARGTSPWFYAAWVGVVLLGAALWYSARNLHVGITVAFGLLFAVVLVLALLFLNFFRDPERTPGVGLVAPADGLVQAIDEWEDGRTRVATFMNPLNVHVNRAPLDGKVVSVTHVRGGFIPAFNKESETNERVVWHFDTQVGDLEVVQITGAVAKRIIPYLDAGAVVKKGERIGIIRLGSRVDVYLPPGIVPAVKVGDKMVAGETTLAKV